MKNPNGYGSVYKLSGNRRKPYVAQITKGYEIENGKCIQKRENIGYFGTRKEAMLFLASYNQKPHSERSEYRLRDFVDAWKIDAYSKIRESSQAAYDCAINKMSEYLDTKISDFNKQSLQDYICRNKIAPSTLKKFKVVLIGSLNLAKDNGLTDVEYDFISRVESREKEKKVVRKIVPKNVIDELWNEWQGNVLAAWTLCLIYTGLRISELIDLKPENCHENYIEIAESKTKTGIREVPLCNRILPVFAFLIENDKLPIHSKKLKQKSKYVEIKAFHDKLDILPHDTRHTFITRSLELGIEERIVKSTVGHKEKDITSIYNHIFVERKITAYADFDY